MPTPQPQLRQPGPATARLPFTGASFSGASARTPSFRLAVLAGAVLFGSLLAGAAFGQSAEMGLPSIAKDRGLRTGDFLLRPSVGVIGHYDTNVFNASPQEVLNNPIHPAASLRIVPKLSLQNDLTGNTVFNFVAAGDARVYLSGEQIVKNLNAFGGNAALDVTFGQRKPIGFTLFDMFTRSLRANNWETQQTFNRNANDVGARVEFHPGDVPERRPFNIALMGSYALDRFDDYSNFNTNTIRTRMNGSWRFLPKTAAYIDATWDFRSYSNPFLITNNLASNSKPFRARLGASGAITKRISFDLNAGWGMALISNPSVPSFNSYVAGASFGFRPTDSTRLSLGYNHDLRDAYLGSFAESHRMSFSAKQRFGSMVDLVIGANVSYLKYGAACCSSPDVILVVGAAGVPGLPGYFQRKDWQIDGSVAASFEVSRFVALQIGYNLRSVITPFKLTSKTVAVLDAGEYTAHEMFASVTARY